MGKQLSKDDGTLFTRRSCTCTCNAVTTLYMSWNFKIKVDSHWERLGVAPTLKRLEKSSKRRWDSRSRAQNFGSYLERLWLNVHHRLGTFADGGQRKRTFPSVRAYSHQRRKMSSANVPHLNVWGFDISAAEFPQQKIRTSLARWRVTFFRRRTSRCLQNLVRQRVPF